jgi:hypothetical protein
MSVIGFPNASHRRHVVRRVRSEPSMHSLLVRSRDLILQSDETDLVRDLCFDIDKAQTKLKAIRRRLQGLQEYSR